MSARSASPRRIREVKKAMLKGSRDIPTSEPVDVTRLKTARSMDS
ncbi:hypothetical protein [Longimicrobium sp.]